MLLREPLKAQKELFAVEMVVYDHTRKLLTGRENLQARADGDGLRDPDANAAARDVIEDRETLLTHARHIGKNRN
jgi:hypothetical protein